MKKGERLGEKEMKEEQRVTGGGEVPNSEHSCQFSAYWHRAVGFISLDSFSLLTGQFDQNSYLVLSF